MMTKGRTGWRKWVAVATLTCALGVPAASVYAQAPAPTAVRTATPRPMTASPAAGEPIQDATMAALVLGAMVVGGLTLKRLSERRG